MLQPHAGPSAFAFLFRFHLIYQFLMGMDIHLLIDVLNMGLYGAAGPKLHPGPARALGCQTAPPFQLRKTYKNCSIAPSRHFFAAELHLQACFSHIFNANPVLFFCENDTDLGFQNFLFHRTCEKHA